jgi:hypothetical protein
MHDLRWLPWLSNNYHHRGAVFLLSQQGMA